VHAIARYKLVDFLRRTRTSLADEFQILKTPCTECVDASIFASIGLVPARFAQTKGINVRRRANLKHKNQFVLRAIKRSHSAVGFIPNAQVF
jgi:hypothetical protein